MRIIRRYFQFEKHRTSFRTEIIAGITTFMTMSYIIVVNPKILQAAGIPIGASTTATILTAALGTLLMGIYARRPFAVAPYMGENAFIAYTVVLGLGLSWQTALGAIFIGGVLFILLTVFRLRKWLVEAIPEGLRYSFAVGIGLFMTFIGMNEAGLITLGTPDAPVRIARVTSAPVLVAVLGFLIIAVLLLRRVPGAILAGILITTALAMVIGVAQIPQSWISLPPAWNPHGFSST